MNNLNSILIEGNLVKDPLFRTTAKGTSLCTFTLASNRYYKQDAGLEKETSFFDVETWSKLADNCKALGRKGRGARVVGRLKQDRWNDAEGKLHTRICIIAEHVEFKPEFKRNDSAEASGGEAHSVRAGNFASFPVIPSREEEMATAVSF
jgi:single-strand DNA-binding protein